MSISFSTDWAHIRFLIIGQVFVNFMNSQFFFCFESNITHITKYCSSMFLISMVVIEISTREFLFDNARCIDLLGMYISSFQFENLLSKPKHFIECNIGSPWQICHPSNWTVEFEDGWGLPGVYWCYCGSILIPSWEVSQGYVVVTWTPVIPNSNLFGSTPQWYELTVLMLC